MVARLEGANPLCEAATYVYTSNGLPDADRHAGDGGRFNPHRPQFQPWRGEYTLPRCSCHTPSRYIVSWIVAVLFARRAAVASPSCRPRCRPITTVPGRFTLAVPAGAGASVRRRWLTIIRHHPPLFLVSLAAWRWCKQQQFFPPSDRPELIVDWNLPQKLARSPRTRDQTSASSSVRFAGNADIDHWSSLYRPGRSCASC